MTFPTRFKWHTWLLIGLSVAACLWLLWLTPAGGVIITRDSGSYISAGRSLLEGEGFLRYNRDIYARWPPLYPVVLAGLETITAPLGLNLLDALRLFNVLTFGALVGVSGLLFLRLLHNPLLALLATVTVILNWPLTLVSVHAWSEPLFNVLVLLFVLALAHFMTDPRPRNLVWPVLFASLSSLQRYSGIVTVMTGVTVMALLLTANQQKWRTVLWFAFTAAVPLILWNTYNQLVAGDAVGYWELGGQTVPRAVERTLLILGSWLLPGRGPLQVWIGAGLVGLIILICAAQFRQRHALRLTLSLFILSFMLLTIALAVITNVALDDRMYSPIFVPVTGLVFLLVESALERLPQRPNRRVLLAAGSIIFTLGLLLARTENLTRELTILRENCCRDNAWADSAFVALLRDQPEKLVAWNTAPEKSRIYTGFFGNRLPQSLEAIERWREDQTHDLYIIWYAFSKDYPYRYTLAELQAALPLEPLLELDGSGLYRVPVG